MTVEIQVLTWDKHKKGGLYRLMGSQLSHIDNCINKQTKNLQLLKIPHTITKMNENINIESTIVG